MAIAELWTLRTRDEPKNGRSARLHRRQRIDRPAREQDALLDLLRRQGGADWVLDLTTQMVEFLRQTPPSSVSEQPEVHGLDRIGSWICLVILSCLPASREAAWHNSSKISGECNC